VNSDRPRAREAGIQIGSLPVGPNNAITDVPGVRIGHTTLIDGEGKLVIGSGPVRTGVTAILPPGNNWWKEPVEAGNHVINGAGTTAGLSFIDEYHRIETPILLTNTLSVGTAFEGIVRYMVDHCFEGRSSIPWFNPVVGETSDAGSNDIGGLHVKPEHCIEAIRSAAEGSVEEGCVGGGTGMNALGWKGGIGTSSRVVEIEGDAATIGVLVQANFGGTLTIAGVNMADLQPEPHEEKLGASIMIIYATDLPLSGSELDRVAKRATFGLARTGSKGGHGSGDYVIGFSTTYRNGQMQSIRDAITRSESLIDIPFQAIADATEEAILNAIFKATRLVGYNGTVREPLPINQVLGRLRRLGVIDN
jgi:D-aminopeptidase